jgi:hypothetical protein
LWVTEVGEVGKVTLGKNEEDRNQAEQGETGGSGPQFRTRINYLVYSP